MPAVTKVGCCAFPRRLDEYARRLPLVEVQQTFYKPPQTQTAVRWRARVPPDFEFTLKAWQLITHPSTSPTYRRLGWEIPPAEQRRYGFFAPTEEVVKAWERTREIARALRATVVVFQCPASFTPTRIHLANLRRFFTRVRRGGLHFAWEVRGEWPENLVASLCRDLDLIHCVDPFVGPSRYGEPRYYRLHGRGGYRYQYVEADFAMLQPLCTGETYVLFNNMTMWDDALRFQAQVAPARPGRGRGTKGPAATVRPPTVGAGRRPSARQ